MYIDRVCHEGDLGLGKDMVPQMTVVSCLKSIFNNLIMYENDTPLRKRAFILDKKVNYVQHIYISKSHSKLWYGE